MGPALGNSAVMDQGRGSLITLRRILVLESLSTIARTIKMEFKIRIIIKIGLDLKMPKFRNVLYFRHHTRGSLLL